MPNGSPEQMLRLLLGEMTRCHFFVYAAGFSIFYLATFRTGRMPIYLACRPALRIYDIVTCTRLHNYCVRSALPVAMEIHTQKIAIAIKKTNTPSMV